MSMIDKEERKTTVNIVIVIIAVFLSAITIISKMEKSGELRKPETQRNNHDGLELEAVSASFARNYTLIIERDKIHKEISQAANHGVFMIWIDNVISPENSSYFEKLGYSVFINKLQQYTTISW